MTFISLENPYAKTNGISEGYELHFKCSIDEKTFKVIKGIITANNLGFKDYDGCFIIYTPKKSWGLICNDCAEPKQIERDYATWEREFITRQNALLAKNLAEEPEKYVVSMNMWEINQLTDIQPKDAVWIKSSCEPFCDEMELDEERKKNWLNRFQIEEHHAHASGHACGNELKLMIARIHPENLIPIHTEHPELFS